MSQGGCRRAEVVLDGDWSDEEAAELEALAEVLPPDFDVVGLAIGHDLLRQAGHGREEAERERPFDDVFAEMDGTAGLEDVTESEAEYLREMVALGQAYVRDVRVWAAAERLRRRISAVKEIRADLLNAGRTAAAAKLAQHIEGAKVRMRERNPLERSESALRGHESRVNILADQLQRRALDDPERDAAVGQAKKAINRMKVVASA